MSFLLCSWQLPEVHVILAVAILLLGFVYRDRPIFVSQCDHIKGPSGLPLIGNTLQVLKDAANPLQAMLARSMQYGLPNTMTVIGMGRAINVTRPDWIQHIQKTNFANYVKGPKLRACLHDLLGDGIFNADGNTWKAQRKVGSNIMTTSNLKNLVSHVLDAQSERFCALLQQASQKAEPVDLQSAFFDFTIQTFLNIAFSTDLDSVQSADSPAGMEASASHLSFAEAFDLAQQLSVRRINRPWWKLNRHWSSEEKKLQGAIRKIDDCLFPLIERRSSDESSNTRPDLLGLFLAYRDEQSGESLYRCERIEMQANVDQLRKAIYHVAATNDSLRTTFTVNSKGEPMAKVLPISKLPTQLVRVLLQPEADDEDEAQAQAESHQAAMSYVQRWARDSLDLSKTAFETVIIPISDRRVLFGFKIHHIVFDGFSAALLAQRIVAAYMNETGSEVSNCSPSPQFSLLANDLDGKDVEDEERIPVDAFWRSVHRESPKAFIRHPRRHTATENQDGLVTLNLSAATSRGIYRLARAAGCSSFVYLLTAFMQLLSDFEMQDDFLVASPVTKRSDTCVQSYISDPEFDFAAVLRHIQNATSMDVEKEVAPAANPLFLWFNMHEFALEAELQTSELTVTRSKPLWSGVAKFPLGLELFPQADGSIECVWEYQGGAYLEEEVNQLASAFGDMLELAANHDGSDGSWLHAKDSTSLRALQIAGPDVKTGADDTCDLVSLFRTSVQQFSTRVAIEDSVDHRTYTYSVVDRRTDHLASLIRTLLAAQVDQQTTRHVMLALERGPHLTMAMLVVIKAGAAYVPLDLSNPAERNCYITAQVGAQLVLVDHRTESRFVEELPISHLNAESVISSDPPTSSIGPLPDKIDASLDADGNWLDDAPTFATGQLFISGQGLADGYTDPVKTTGAFINHPFTGERLYKTGDLARYLGNGEIEFIGRSDTQVKIRGYRIELDEIQQYLESVPGVERAAALVESDSIVGALVMTFRGQDVPQAQPCLAQINEILALHLPRYMLVDHVIHLDALPLSANGKVDVKALSKEAQTLLASKLITAHSDRQLQLPSTMTQAVIPCLRLKGAIEREFGVIVTLKELFKQPCRLGEIAQTIDQLILQMPESGKADADANFTLAHASTEDLDPYAPFPLTPIQAAYLLGRGDQLDLGGVSAHSYVEYRLPTAFVALHGASLMSRVVGRIVDQLVARHDALRLVFDIASQTQRVLRNDDVPAYSVRSIDLREESDEEVIQASIQQIRDEMEALVLDATAWPLFDIVVTLLPKGDAVLHVSLDMLIMDFASSAILAQEFVELASSRIENVDTRATAARTVTSSIFKYHVLAERHLRTKEPEATVTPTFGRREAIIARSDFERLRNTASSFKVSLGSVLASAFAKVLFRFASHTHFAINLTLFSRQADAAQHSTVGDFTSSLLLEFDERCTPTDFLAEVLQTEECLVQDVENSAFAGVEFIRLLNAQRNGKTMYPVVMTMVLHETAFKPEVIEMFGEPIYAITQTPQVDLDFQCIRAINGDLVLRFDFLKDMFPESYIEDMHATLHAIVQRLCETDMTAWTAEDGQIPVQVPSVQETSRTVFNDTARLFNSSNVIELLHQGFLCHLQTSSSAEAVADADGKLTYGQLGVIVAALQTRLAQHQFRTPVRVAVILPKGRYQVAGCLAVLTLGFAYVPIEHDAPASRIRTVIEEAECAAAIIGFESPALDALPDTCSVVSVRTKTDDLQPVSSGDVQDAIAQLHQSSTKVRIARDDEAYLIFTSGSTGKPKGVVIQHGAVANTINDLVARWSLTDKDTFLGLAKLSFDLSVFDIFAALTVGGKLVLPPSLDSGDVHDPQEWLSLIVEHRVSIWNSVPTMAQMLLSTRATRLRKDLASLRIMLLSGDRFPVDLAKGLLEVCPSEMTLYSGGGATEASVWSVLHQVQANDVQKRNGSSLLISYGRLMNNQTMYVLQATGKKASWRHAPSFVPGKLFIGGVGLAKGYTGAEKTEASFFDLPGLGRLYDTGDVVRFMPSGELEFLGRRDLQVKIRGHRIELEEITHRLKQVPGVDDGVVKVINGQLVGFAVPRNEMPSVEALTGLELLSDDLERLALKAHLAEAADTILEGAGQRWEVGAALVVERNEKAVRMVQDRRSHYHFDSQPPSTLEVTKAYDRALRLASSVFDLNNEYRYPSAGATYSVRVLLELQGVEGAEDGVYLLDQKAAKMWPISGKKPSDVIGTTSFARLIFVSHLPAIAPLYGDATPLFTRLEMGYMLGAMSIAACEHNLCFRLQQSSSDGSTHNHGLDTLLELSLAILSPLSCPPYLAEKGFEVEMSLEVATHDGNAEHAFDIKASGDDQPSTVQAVHAGWDLSKQPLAFHHNATLLQEAKIIVTITAERGPEMAAAFAQLFEEASISSSADGSLSLGWTQSPWICDDWVSSFQHAFRRKPDIILLGGRVAATGKTAADPTPQPLEVANGHLSQSLPSYMLLSSLVPVFGGIPLSGNGKVDHAKLAELANAHAASSGSTDSFEDEYPLTKQEQLIAEAWAEALDISVAMIEINTTFFQLGGNSLSSIKLQNLLRQRLHIELDLKTIFRQPTIKGIDAAVTKSRAAGGASGNTEEGISSSVMLTLEVPERENDPFPLTAIQEAYLLGRSSAFAIGNIATHAYLEFEAPPGMSSALLTTLIGAIVRKHDAMRLVFDFDTQTQRVLREDELPDRKVDDFDLTKESPQVVHSVRESIRDEMSHQVISPDRWPLFDIRLSRASSSESSSAADHISPAVLHVSLDMLIMDFFSSAILASDLVNAARQFNAQGHVELAQPPITFRQFVVAEHHHRMDSGVNADREYWLQREDLASLEANAAAAGVTTSAAIATAFGRVLARYSETTNRFAINLTVFSRPAEYVGIEQVMGDFTTSILLDYDDDARSAAHANRRSDNAETFVGRASKVNLQLLDDISHASGYSGIEFARHLRSKTGQDIVYPVVMTCVLSDFGASHSLRDVRDLLGDVSYSVSQTSQVSIDFQCVRKANGDLSVRWDYLQELFHKGFIEEAHAAFVHMLRHLASHREAWTAEVSPEINLLSNENVKNRLDANSCLQRTPITESNPKIESLPLLIVGDTLLHRGFLRHMRASPERCCITGSSESISYGQLGLAVARILPQLQQAGVVTRDRVAVLMPKSWYQAAACLATLSLGASYVPIEVTQPRVRIETILAEAGCRAVLTASEATTDLSYVRLPMIKVQSDFINATGSESTHDLTDRLIQMSDSIDASQEANVIFTSGSTGKPKGVRMSHAAAMNTINDLLGRWSCNAKDVFFQLANLSFDLSVFDLFGSLTAGAHLVLPSGRIDAGEWAYLVQKHRVTIWNSVPMHIQMVLAAIADGGSEHIESFDTSVLESVRICLLSGDKVPVDTVRTLSTHLREIDIYSGGGATEAGIWSILYPISRELADDAAFVPYGKAMQNQCWYVLNSRLEPCPTFVAGELLIGGESLALGYTDANQTERAFVELDVDGSGKQRLYRTADFGRFLASGDIQILGRKDDQIKIRGHRVELGEIEMRILEVEGVHEAAVVLSTGATPADVSLHAFVTQAREWFGDAAGQATASGALSETEIRHHLECTLQRYMVPSSISMVEKLEVSTNGKVDRKSLASKVQQAHELYAAEQQANVTSTICMLSNALERSIQAIWAQVLKVEAESIGCDQDFFSLGGNSLSAVRALTSIKRSYGVKVDVATILQHPTVQSVALHLVKLGVDTDTDKAAPVESGGSVWTSLLSR
ncbi:related to siderophore peptide synthetase involved in ferrichromeA biosynthesis [Ustilago bromivora]|uniref:Related to siderophore peptide synthetase involved in ferrichromeA biosynthesis n=1 Tax=Ustilago bromivora TaxID=307758 RepID=A0A1K0G776_9BASI|nr:related to siderophore peptide synthetase involved in ferrichromeA biosynthesis [Ustilago bromivora]